MPVQTLVRMSIPHRLVDEMMLKTGGAFEVPNTAAGHKLVFWWKTASKNDRDDIMRRASSKAIPLIDAWNEKLSEVK